ncbi:hypothetical protein N7492_004381 [Penicillium capsulatum]|uniref:RNA polymerase II holoenzyme cyclin-like subunit n=1 Tax=Penicillium capsulatum TaxID=69766 RepID=A0A9W9LR36_9EURO|nr:hypothetical protein N7492_004381 [Penicillium capsulatum]KAJ6136499.1 hypothetical protein N7512_001659 [Penicillium capsulatum]
MNSSDRSITSTSRLADHMMADTRDEALHQGSNPGPAAPEPPPIHPSFIQVAKPYVFEQSIEDCIQAMGVNPLREDSLRLQGVTGIDNMRKKLNLPVRTFNTAVVYYHRFRLVHPDSEYSATDAAVAALFTACKIEDTLKKSREIVCAAWNLKKSPSEQLTPDHPDLDTNARAVIGLERLMLEASGFDFRTRHPQKTLTKLSQRYQLLKDSPVSLLAYRISLDLYRTFAPMKQTTPAMAFACLELATRLLDRRIEELESGVDYEQWGTNRAEVMETLFDLLELYTHHRAQTSVGPHFPADRFLTVRIPLNDEAAANHICRHTESQNRAQPRDSAQSANGLGARHAGTPQRPAHPLTPIAANGDRHRSARGQDAAVRFMLDPEIAEAEKKQVEAYFKVETEAYEVDG